jgi:hypothetical protein
MFDANQTSLVTNNYYTIDKKVLASLNLGKSFTTNPNEYRTSNGGLKEEFLYDIFKDISRQVSEAITASFFSSLDTIIQNIIPPANYSAGTAGTIQWNTTQAPGAGQVSFSSLLNGIALPIEMQYGGVASDWVTVWVSSNDFRTLKQNADIAPQFNSKRLAAFRAFSV